MSRYDADVDPWALVDESQVQEHIDQNEAIDLRLSFEQRNPREYGLWLQMLRDQHDEDQERLVNEVIAEEEDDKSPNFEDEPSNEESRRNELRTALLRELSIVYPVEAKLIVDRFMKFWTEDLEHLASCRSALEAEVGDMIEQLSALLTASHGEAWCAVADSEDVYHMILDETLYGDQARGRFWYEDVCHNWVQVPRVIPWSSTPLSLRFATINERGVLVIVYRGQALDLPLGRVAISSSEVIDVDKIEYIDVDAE